MNKLNQAIKVIILSLILSSSCSFKRNSFENYSQTINETLNPASSILKENQNIYDVEDLSGCGYMISLNPWYSYKLKDGSERWGRSREWREESGIISYAGFSLNVDRKDDQNSTPNLTKNPLIHIVYIGPWQYSKRVGKEIRFVAYTGIGGGDFRYQFESKTPENQNILSKEYSIPGKKITAPKTSICTVKWIANHGYNSISKVKSKNPFSKNYMVPSGEIIQVED
jgi:hypothetical protein